MRFWVLYFLTVSLNAHAFPCTKIGCRSSTLVEIKCSKQGCPKQAKVSIDNEIVLDSCKKDGWKTNRGDLFGYFQFKDADKTGSFSVRTATPTSSIKKMIVFAGASCKSLQKVLEANDIPLARTEFYPNGKECDKKPCMTYSGKVEIASTEALPCGEAKSAWASCAKDSDCVGALNECGFKTAFNAKSLREIETFNHCVAPTISCPVSDQDPNKLKTKCICKAHKCEFL